MFYGQEVIDRVDASLQEAWRVGKPVYLSIGKDKPERPVLQVEEFEPVLRTHRFAEDEQFGRVNAAGRFGLMGAIQDPVKFNLLGLVEVLNGDNPFAYVIGQKTLQEISDRFGITDLDLGEAA